MYSVCVCVRGGGLRMCVMYHSMNAEVGGHLFFPPWLANRSPHVFDITPSPGNTRKAWRQHLIASIIDSFFS